MSFLRLCLASSSLALALTSTAFAGPVSDFEARLRDSYGAYRTALFQTNAGSAEKSAAAVQSFLTQWDGLIAEYGEKAPPHYADDAQFAATLDAVRQSAEEAGKTIAAGDLPEAHEGLEGIRDDIAALHERNGIIGFSDRMNAYHAEMEHVLGADYDGLSAAGIEALQEDAAVLSYLAKDILAHPAPEAGAPGYGELATAFEKSVTGLVEAARAGDAGAIKSALGGLKAPYSKFFAKFG